MQNIILLMLCLLAGVLLRRSGRVPENAHLAFNGFIIYVALPALVLKHIHDIHIKTELLYSVAMPWLLFLTGATLFCAMARCLSFTRQTTGALILTGGLGNTSFIGLPIIEAFYGKGSLAIGVLIDQLGTYLVLGTLGVMVASICSNDTVNARAILLRIVAFPPLIALLLAVPLIDVVYPDWLTASLGRLGDTLAPLALVSVGLQLRLDALRTNGTALALGLGFKLLIGPALLLLLYSKVTSVSEVQMQVTLLESSMAPQIGAAVVANQYGLNPSLVTLMVGVGTVLSLVTVPAWWTVLRLL